MQSGNFSYLSFLHSHEEGTKNPIDDIKSVLKVLGLTKTQNSSLIIIQGLLRFTRLKFHLVCMTSLFTLVPYYPPWDRSKKLVYQATLLC